MCKLKSAIALKDRIFMPDYDSHSDMLKELGINDDYLGASKKFVRVELSPKDGDPFSDIDKWGLTVDQDIRPDWFDEEECEEKMIAAVKEWAKTHIFVGVDNLKLNSGSNYYIKDCNDVEIYGSATVKYIYGSATVENIYGSATVKKAYGTSMICSSVFEWKNKISLILSENATFKDNIGKVIYQAGDFKLVSVESGKAISEAKVGEKIT